MKQRIAIVLVFLMMLSVLPSAVFAEDEADSNGQVARIEIYAAGPIASNSTPPDESAYKKANGETYTATGSTSKTNRCVWFKALAYDSNDKIVENAEISWSTEPEVTGSSDGITFKTDNSGSRIYVTKAAANGNSCDVIATCGKVSAKVTFNVKIALTGVKWGTSNASIWVGDTEESGLILTSTPAGIADTNDFVFESFDPEILPVENISVEKRANNYIVKCNTLKTGEFDLTVKLKENTSVQDTIHVTVENRRYPGVVGSTVEVYVGAEKELEYKLYPVSLDQTLIWESSDSSVATVDNGIVTGVKEGTVRITGTSVADPTAVFEWKITVQNAGIKLEKSLGAADLPEEVNWNVTEHGANAHLYFYHGSSFLSGPDWYSSNSDIATIVSGTSLDENGTITFTKDGTVTITAVNSQLERLGQVTFHVSGFGVSSDLNTGWKFVNDGQGDSGKVQLINYEVENQSLNEVWYENRITELVPAGDCLFTLQLTSNGKGYTWSDEMIQQYESMNLPKISICELNKDGTAGAVIASYQNGYELVSHSYDGANSTTIQLTLKIQDGVLKRGTDYALVCDKNLSAFTNATGRLKKDVSYQFTTQHAAKTVTLNQTEAALKIGEGLSLIAELDKGAEAKPDDVVVWTSDKDDIATVDQDGNITAKKAGTAVITAKALYGGVIATCTVTVEADAVDPTEPTDPLNPIGPVDPTDPSDSGQADDGVAAEASSNSTDSAKTGDNMNLWVLAGIMLISLCGAAGTVLYRRKQKMN